MASLSIGVYREEVDRAVEKNLLTDKHDWSEYTPEQVKQAAAEWLQDLIEDILADLDYYTCGPNRIGRFDKYLR